jgi:hypothetical protein
MISVNKKAFEAFVSKAFKLDSEAVAGLYNEAGEITDLSPLEEADQQRIKKLKEDSSSQYKRGLKEGASKIESELKDKYDVESEFIGVELIDHILQTEVEKVKGAAADDITKHPEYLKALADADKALRKKDKEWQEKFEARDLEIKKQSLMNKLKESALVELETLNPLLPEDPAKAKKWKEKYVEELYNSEYVEIEGKFVLSENGKPKLNEHGYQVEFKDHAKNVASGFFDFKAADDRSSSGNKEYDTKGKTAPKDQDEYVARMREAKTPEERAELTMSWTAKQKS